MMVMKAYQSVLLAGSLGVLGFTVTRWVVKPAGWNALSGSALAPGAVKTGAVGSVENTPQEQAQRPSMEQILEADPKLRLERLVAWLPEATAEEVAAMVSALDLVGGGKEGEWEACVRRWVEVDPDAALLHARQHSMKTLDGFHDASGMSCNVKVRSVEAYKALLQLDLEGGLARLAQERPPLLAQLLRQLVSAVEQARKEAWAVTFAHLPDSRLWAANPPSAPPRIYRGLGSLREAGEAIKLKLAAKDLKGGRADIDAMPQNYHRALLEMEYAKALAEQKSPA